MEKNSQRGSVVLDVLLVLALAGSLAFAIWSFLGRQDYKNHLNQKVATAVAAREADLEKQAQDKLDQQNTKQFQGTSTYGTISFNYPKTWSAYVDQTNPSEPINAYFYPDQVPGTQSPTAFALRLELVSTPYTQVLQQFSSQITSGQVKATAYVPEKLKNVANVQPGTRLDGSIAQDTQGNPLQGSLVAITVRDKTLELSTQSPNFLSDFNNIILPSLTFVP